MRYMTSNEIRNTYLEYFKEHGHTIMPSASLLILNDCVDNGIFNVDTFESLISLI